MPLSCPRPTALAVALVSLAGAAEAQMFEMRPGVYEVIVSAPGAKPTKNDLCIRAQQAKDVAALMAKGDTSTDCEFSNESVSGNTRAADVSCTKPLRSKGRVTVVAESPDSFAITHDLRMEFGGVMQPVSMKMAYRRLGDCE